MGEKREIRKVPIEKLEGDPVTTEEDVDLLPDFVIVRPEPDSDKFLVTLGHRRFQAAKIAGLEELPCMIRRGLKSDDAGPMCLSI